MVRALLHRSDLYLGGQGAGVPCPPLAFSGSDLLALSAMKGENLPRTSNLLQENPPELSARN